MIIRSTRVVTADAVRPTAVAFENGIIKAVAAYHSKPDFDFGESIISPGLIDAHVHVNEPGRTEWEGFETVGRAAVAGGFSSLVDMPLNCLPATTTPAALKLKQAAANKCKANCFFWAGVIPSD